MNSLLKHLLLVGLLLFNISIAHAGEFENRLMSDALFDFFEDEFPVYFSPATNSIITTDGVGYYRAYPNNTYLWQSGGRIYYQLFGSGWSDAGTIREVNDWLCQGYCIRAFLPSSSSEEPVITQNTDVDYYNPVSSTTTDRYADYSYIYSYEGYNYYLYNSRDRDYVYASSDWRNWLW